MDGFFTRARPWGIAVVFAVVVLLAGCARLYQSWYLSRCSSEIRKASAAIDTAGSDLQRAAAFADRGAAYAEKARYGRAMKRIAGEEYERLFAQAIHDHGQAIALDPENAERYYARGRAYFDRAALDILENQKAVSYLTSARADFSKALEKHHQHAMALDMLGLTDASLADWTQAIVDFEREATLDPRMGYRVSDAYCNRGSVYLKERKFDLAVPDFRQAIATRSKADPCECEPYNSLLAIYLTQTQDYDQARALVARAKASGVWIAPEYLDQLKKLGDDRKPAGGK